MPPNTEPKPIRDSIANFPPAQADAMMTLFNQGMPFWLTLAFTSATADAAVLYTVPTGYRMFIHRTCWEIIADMTGGASSAIGLSSSATGFTTKGDLLGGAAGDVAATLVAGIKGGTLGADFASNGVIVLPAAATIRFDRITSAFTAGSGQAHLQISMLPTT